MSTHAVILDWPLGSGASAASLLTTPLATRLYGAYLFEWLDEVDPLSVSIAPRCDVTPAYERELATALPGAAILPGGGLEGLLTALEPSDVLLLVDSRYVSVAGAGFRGLLHSSAAGRVAQHLVHHPRSRVEAFEQVVCEPDGSIRAIERLYDGVTQLRSAGVSASLVSIAALRAIRLAPGHVWSLDQIRVQLAGARILTGDVPVATQVWDLSTPAGWLGALHQQVTRDAERALPAGWQRGGAGAVCADGADVDATAQLRGAVVVHRGARVGAEAVVVGPAVLGPGSTVGAGAMVAFSFVDAGVTIEAGAALVNGCHWRGRAEAALATGEATILESDFFAPVGAGAGRTPDGGAQRVKRLFDAGAAAVGLLLSLPLLLAVAALIKLTSRGPILFGHEREGRGGRPFRCWKFRTMIDRAHQAQRKLYAASQVDGPQFKIAHDPRITRLGRFLRRSNIDELPQLWNVLRGEMSLIGPRPSPFRENQICVPWRKARLSIRPGITGLWQVCRHDRDTGDFHQWIHFDTLYVRHQSLWLDFKILIATVVTLGGRRSVPVTWLLNERSRRRERRASRLPVLGRRPSSVLGPQREQTVTHMPASVEAGR